jgi:hypothetical protein
VTRNEEEWSDFRSSKLKKDKIPNPKHQITNKLQAPMTKTKRRETDFQELVRGGNANLRSLQKKIFNAFVLVIGIWNFEFI